MDIPYKYEYPVKLKDGRTVYPDFIILTRNRNQILFEHFGMMDNSDYANDGIDKIYRYAEMGFIQGKNIIYTFETSTNPLNQSTIYRIVNEFFLIVLFFILQIENKNNANNDKKKLKSIKDIKIKIIFYKYCNMI